MKEAETFPQTHQISSAGMQKKPGNETEQIHNPSPGKLRANKKNTPFEVDDNMQRILGKFHNPDLDCQLSQLRWSRSRGIWREPSSKPQRI
jgi:hypothetical protein